LKLPYNIKPIAYLCLGHVDKFKEIPDLEESKWLKRLDLQEVVFFEKWNDNDNAGWSKFKNIK
jgi:5,6-dimethylbenzimidazole synthase